LQGNHFTELDAFWRDKNNVAEAKRVFNIYDKDKSGHLDRDEFGKFCHDFYKYFETKGMAKYLCLDHSASAVEGYLNSRFDKLVRPFLFVNRKTLKFIINYLHLEIQDINKDGKISFEEFSTQIMKMVKN
jgi:Ca2+-binding EF-hand superfamily protein